MSSSQLQYIVELGGQQLLPVSSTDFDGQHAPIHEHLRLLRDKAHAWFRFHLNPFETVSIPPLMFDLDVIKSSIVDGHLYLWDDDTTMMQVRRILPKLSQQIDTHHNVPPHSLPYLGCHGPTLDVFMDPEQNLLALAYSIPDDHGNRFLIHMRALDEGGIHPQAAGSSLFLSGLPAQGNQGWSIREWKLKGFGKHIALLCLLMDRTSCTTSWWLQIWDWQLSATSNVSHDL